MRVALRLVAALALMTFAAVAILIPPTTGTSAWEVLQAFISGAKPAKDEGSASPKITIPAGQTVPIAMVQREPFPDFSASVGAFSHAPQPSTCRLNDKSFYEA